MNEIQIEKVFCGLKKEKLIKGVIIQKIKVDNKEIKKVSVELHQKRIDWYCPWFTNKIYYNKKYTSNVNCSDNEWKFVLLHEQGHREYRKESNKLKKGNFSENLKYDEEYFCDNYSVKKIIKKMNLSKEECIEIIKSYSKNNRRYSLIFEEDKSCKGNKDTSSHPSWKKRIEKLKLI